MRKEKRVATSSVRGLSGKALSLAMTLAMAFGLVFGIAGTASATTSDGKTVLAFTADTHNNRSNDAAKRLGTWIDNANTKYSQIDLMGFCGDLGPRNGEEAAYWTATQALMTAAEDKLGASNVLYTTGNYEYTIGNFATTENALKNVFKLNQQGASGSNYVIYCMGTEAPESTSTTSTSTEKYTVDQVQQLADFLNAAGSSKTIIVMSHYPLHYYKNDVDYSQISVDELLERIPEQYRETFANMDRTQLENMINMLFGGIDNLMKRQTTNADLVIDTLNSAADSGKKIVFLWGHNHTYADPYYDEVFVSGDNLEYKAGSKKTIKFSYAAAGCMSDTEITGSSTVKGKGLIITIDSRQNLAFAYLDADGNDVTESHSGDTPVHTHVMTKVEAREPTCILPGNSTYWTCTSCGKIFTDEAGTNEATLENTVIPATGHDLTKTEAKAATCTSDGNIAYWTCSKCHRIFSDAEARTEITLANTVVPAVEHKLTKTEAKAATCTADGNIEYWTCSSCGKRFSDADGKKEVTASACVIKATGHDYELTTCTWAKDYSSATGTLVCKNDTSHKKTVQSTEVTSQETENGTEYTATFVDDGKTYTKTKSYEPAGEWERLAGAKGTGRLGTMAAIVQKGFESSEYAVLSTGWNFPDALVASSVAGQLDCPVILTDPAKLSTEAAGELKRLGVEHVYIMGSANTVKDAVVTQLGLLNITDVKRIEGGDRRATSLEAMKWLDKNGAYDGTVVLTTGVEFADALAIGPWCYAEKVPILLTDKSGKLSDEQFAALEQGTGLTSGTKVKKVIVLGGTNRVSKDTRKALASLVGESNVVEIAGNSRYETAAKIAEFEILQGMSAANVTVTKGTNYPDALAGAALDGKLGSVMILVNEKGSVTQGENLQALNFVKEYKDEVDCGYVLGDENSVPKTLWDALNSITKK